MSYGQVGMSLCIPDISYGHTDISRPGLCIFCCCLDVFLYSPGMFYDHLVVSWYSSGMFCDHKSLVCFIAILVCPSTVMLCFMAAWCGPGMFYNHIGVVCPGKVLVLAYRFLTLL